MKEVQELDIYVHPSSLMHNYWVAVCVLMTAGGGLLAVIACWYKRCRRSQTMLGIYRQSLSRIRSRKSKENDKYTGHDRYVGGKIGFRKKRKKCDFKESKSATEIASRAPADGAPWKSASYDQLQEMEKWTKSERASSAGGGKMESLAKLFSCVMVTDRVDLSPVRDRQNHGSYAYTALEPGPNFQERLEMETKACERAHSVCSHYLQSNLRYTLVDQLNDIGSRVDKHWFVVRDSSVKTERLLTLVPRDSKCPIRCDPETRSVILDLFLALQHPYIYPILDVNFREIGSNTYIFTTLPLNEKGSLKDFIYKSQWQENWRQKYFQRAHGLPISQVQRLGRQILEALLFLRERGFPPCGHFHSGNIVLQNGVARITGLENALFGYNSRISPVLLPRAHSEPDAIDSLCFGHVLFEMCAGYELDTPQPSPGNLLDIHQYPQVVEVLEFIFENPEMRLPIIEELLLCDLFRNIDLREIRNQAQSTQVFKTNLTPRAYELLEEVKKVQNGRRRLRLPESFDGENCPRDKSTSSGGSEDEVEDGDYDADTNSESESSSRKEHRSLSLHSNSASRVLISVRNCDD